MRFIPTAVAFVALTTSLAVGASDGQANEAFARDMMTCAFKHTIFAFGPGDALVAQRAADEAQAYLDAAARVSNDDFVKRESNAIKSQSRDAAFAAMASAKDVDGIVAVWKGIKNKCDEQLASLTRPKDR